MIINSATLQALRTNFSALFQGAYDATETWYDKVCTTVPAGTSLETYGFLAQLPQMKLFMGPRTLQNLKEYATQITSQDFEVTIPVDRNSILDDRLGLIPSRIADYAESVRKHPDQLLVAALQSGTAANGFDGVPFFSALHPLSGSNQSNNFTVTPLNSTNYQTVRAAMMSYVGEQGVPLNVRPNLLVVPPALEQTARLIVNADMISDGAGASITNVLKGTADVYVASELANQPTTWYLFATNKSVRGLIYQQTQAPQFYMKSQMTDDNVFFDKQILFGADTREAIGYGPWWLAARAIA